MMKKWIAIGGIALLGLVAAASAGGYFWFRHAIAKSQPLISGEVQAGGLKDDVEIIRDTYGVPHIHAKNEQDLYFATGYAMAQDRLWQMDFTRRLGQGRLSEILGKDLVKLDRFFRMIGASGMNKSIPMDLAFLTRSFADGVNAYLEANQDRLPLEFKILGYSPERWAPDDYQAILKVINWALSLGWRVDLTAGKILDKVGNDKFKEAFPAWPETAPVIIAGKGVTPIRQTDSFVEAMRLADSLTGSLAGTGSNNWVISGEKSVTGKPILANDPHLMLPNPSVWWEVHMVCPTIDVSGFALPGTGGVVIGHNRHMAWGVTSAMVDDVDFYVEKINPENQGQYWYKDRWEDIKVRMETIRVKGEDPVKAELFLTRHGPIVSDWKKGSKEKAISARWALSDCMQPIQAGYRLAKAENLKGVRDALQYWELPALNFIYADDAGNIGYSLCAAVPRRMKGDGLLPVPGWTGEYEWEGYVPFDQRPHAINPREGFIATANNKVTSDHYPHLISHYWEPDDRISRIRQLLNAKEKLSVDDFIRMHQDIYCSRAAELTPQMVKVLEKYFSDIEAKRAREILAKWDYRMDKDSIGACMFEVTLRKMIDNIFKDELGEELFNEYLKTGVFPSRALKAMVKKGGSLWFGNKNLDEIIAISLKQMFSELRRAIGGDMNSWTWGKIHTLTFEHAFGKIKPLSWIFNLGAFPVGGNKFTVNVSHYDFQKPYAEVLGVSMRMIIDLSNFKNSMYVLPTGESGNMGSRHYKDQLNLYLDGNYHPDLTDCDEVEKIREAKIILRPKLKIRK
jgi:penicillin G amidase